MTALIPSNQRFSKNASKNRGRHLKTKTSQSFLVCFFVSFYFMQLSARISLNNCRAARLCNCFCKTSAGGISSSLECSLYTSSEVGIFVQHSCCILCVHRRTFLFPMKERILFKRHGGCLCCVMLVEKFKLKGRHDLSLNEKKRQRIVPTISRELQTMQRT